MSLFFVGVGIPATVLMFALGLYGLYADVNEAFWSGVLVCGLITLVSVVAGLRSEDLRYDSRSTTRSFRVMGYSHLLMLLVFLVPIFGIFKTSGVGMVVLVLALFLSLIVYGAACESLAETMYKNLLFKIKS